MVIARQRAYQRERRGAPYTFLRGSLRDCVDALRSKSESSHHLYEIHTSNSTAMSVTEAMALMPRREDHPAPELNDGES